MTLPSSEYVRITHKLVGSGVARAAAVVYCVRNINAVSIATVAGDARTAFGTTLATAMTVDWSMVETHAKEGPDETGVDHTTTGAAFVGTVPGPTATPQVTYLITKNSNLGGRRGKGRLYLPGVRETYVGVDGALDSTALPLVQQEGDDWIQALFAADIPLYLEHDPATEWQLIGGRPRRVPTGAAPPDPSPVNTVSASAFVATQRRRLR